MPRLHWELTWNSSAQKRGLRGGARMYFASLRKTAVIGKICCERMMKITNVGNIEAFNTNQLCSVLLVDHLPATSLLCFCM